MIRKIVDEDFLYQQTTSERCVKTMIFKSRKSESVTERCSSKKVFWTYGNKDKDTEIRIIYQQDLRIFNMFIKNRLPNKRVFSKNRLPTELFMKIAATPSFPWWISQRRTLSASGAVAGIISEEITPRV